MDGQSAARIGSSIALQFRHVRPSPIFKAKMTWLPSTSTPLPRITSPFQTVLTSEHVGLRVVGSHGKRVVATLVAKVEASGVKSSSRRKILSLVCTEPLFAL